MSKPIRRDFGGLGEGGLKVFDDSSAMMSGRSIQIRNSRFEMERLG